MSKSLNSYNNYMYKHKIFIIIIIIHVLYMYNRAFCTCTVGSTIDNILSMVLQAHEVRHIHKLP